MKNNQEYIYSFPNTSCTIRVINHLRQNYQAYLNSIAVINLIDRWLVKISLNKSISSLLDYNLQAFLNEMGILSNPSQKIILALASLDLGEPLTKIMNRYQVVIVAYGKPEIEEIEIFRDLVVERLGYCPQNMT